MSNDFKIILQELEEVYNVDYRLVEDNVTLLYLSFPAMWKPLTMRNIIVSLEPWFECIGRHYTGDGVILRFREKGGLDL